MSRVPPSLRCCSSPSCRHWTGLGSSLQCLSGPRTRDSRDHQLESPCSAAPRHHAGDSPGHPQVLRFSAVSSFRPLGSVGSAAGTETRGGRVRPQLVRAGAGSEPWPGPRPAGGSGDPGPEHPLVCALAPVAARCSPPECCLAVGVGRSSKLTAGRISRARPWLPGHSLILVSR